MCCEYSCLCYVMYIRIILVILIYVIVLVYSMTNLTKLEFTDLDITGKNYLSWALDAEIHFIANDLENAILIGKECHRHQSIE